MSQVPTTTELYFILIETTMSQHPNPTTLKTNNKQTMQFDKGTINCYRNPQIPFQILDMDLPKPLNPLF